MLAIFKSAGLEADAQYQGLLARSGEISQAVMEETAKLHAGGTQRPQFLNFEDFSWDRKAHGDIPSESVQHWSLSRSVMRNTRQSDERTVGGDDRGLPGCQQFQ